MWRASPTRMAKVVATSAPGTMRIDIAPVADATTIAAAANTLPASTGLTLTRHDNLPTLNGTLGSYANLNVATAGQIKPNFAIVPVGVGSRREALRGHPDSAKGGATGIHGCILPETPA